MNPIDPRAQATLDAAIHLIRTTAASAAMHVADMLNAQAQAAIKITDRDQLGATQQELRRNLLGCGDDVGLNVPIPDTHVRGLERQP